MKQLLQYKTTFKYRSLKVDTKPQHIINATSGRSKLKFFLYFNGELSNLDDKIAMLTSF